MVEPYKLKLDVTKKKNRPRMLSKREKTYKLHVDLTNKSRPNMSIIIIIIIVVIINNNMLVYAHRYICQKS